MAKDFILKDGDLQIENGDFVVGHSDQQHVEDLLIAHKGEYTQNPVLGIGISAYLRAPIDSRVREKLEREIKLQIEADGGKKVKVAVKTIEDIEITASYD